MVCKNKSDGKWGPEKALTSETFPFKKKRNFDLLIYCEESKFLVYVDDCLIGTFEHKVNPRLAEKIQINGDIVLQGVHLK